MKPKSFLIFLLSVIFVSSTVASTHPERESAKPQIAKVAPIQGMDKAPEVLLSVTPVYPTKLRERGIQGVATVELLIDSTGRVIEAKAVRSTMPEFAARAEAAAAQWTFRPAESAGKKITSRVMIPFEFTMPQVAALEAR